MLEWLRLWPRSLPETTIRILDYDPPEYIKIVGQEDFEFAAGNSSTMPITRTVAPQRQKKL